MRRRWESFHAQCQEVFGFPALCGANMDAWIDCLTYLYDGDGMSRFVLQPDEWLRIRLRNTDALRRCQPGILKALVERTEFTNQRYRDAGEPPALALELLQVRRRRGRHRARRCAGRALQGRHMSAWREHSGSSIISAGEPAFAGELCVGRRYSPWSKDP